MTDRTGPHSWDFRLYIVGETERGTKAIANLKKICAEYLPNRHSIEVIDIYEDKEKVREDQVLAVPTLIRKKPRPEKKIIGDLSDKNTVIQRLDLSPQSDADERFQYGKLIGQRKALYQSLIQLVQTYENLNRQSENEAWQKREQMGKGRQEIFHAVIRSVQRLMSYEENIMKIYEISEPETSVRREFLKQLQFLQSKLGVDVQDQAHVIKLIKDWLFTNVFQEEQEEI